LPAPLSGTDEIAALDASFRAMAVELLASHEEVKRSAAEVRKLNEDLELRVAQRTYELAEVNRDVPLLVLGSTRPTLFERRTDWSSTEGIHQRIDLAPLSKGYGRDLANELLKKLPEGQPFRRPDLKLESAKGAWRIQLQDLFERAGITEVKTDLGMRPAHPHQLRDTCAVWYIRKGALIQDVAKMLGDTVAMVERHYLPYIEELKDAHVATNKRILEAAGAD